MIERKGGNLCNEEGERKKILPTEERSVSVILERTEANI